MQQAVADKRPSLALVVDYVPPWLAANFDAVADHLEFTTLSIDRRNASAADTDQRRFSHAVVDGVPSLQSIGDALTRIAPQAVLTFGWTGAKNLAGLSWALDAGVPAIVATDSKADDFGRSPLREKFKSRMLSLYSAAWAAGTHSTHYLQQLGMERERIVAGPVDTIDIRHFEAGAKLARTDEAGMRARLGLPERFFIAVSRLSPEKNLPGLVHAYSRYRARAGTDAWSLVIVGEGPSRGEIEVEISDCGIVEAVKLAGWVAFQDMPAYYGLAGAFILASRKDTWGCVVNEAEAAGLPVLVSTRAGSAPDLVREGMNGFTFDPFEADEIASRMWTLAHGNVDRNAMGAESARIIAGWSPENYAKSLAAVTRISIERARPRATFTERILVRSLAATQLARLRSS